MLGVFISFAMRNSAGVGAPTVHHFMVRWLSDLKHSLGKRTSRESGAESLNLSLTATTFLSVKFSQDDHCVDMKMVDKNITYTVL